MTSLSTTIRVSLDQRERLRKLAEQRDSSMADTFDAALEALKRDQFYREMSAAEEVLRSDKARWANYVSERDLWLNHDLG